jgi:hypothetical protein
MCVGVTIREEERGFITQKRFVSSALKPVVHARGTTATHIDRLSLGWVTKPFKTTSAEL